MSQLQSNGPQDFTRVNRAAPAPRTGITETLQTPGLVTPPPVSQGAILANQLGQALGMVGAVAGDITAVARQRKAEQDHIDKEHAAVWRGNGNLEGRKSLAIFRQQLANNDPNTVPPPGLPVDEWAEKLAAEYVQTKGEMPSAYVEGFRQEFVAPFVGSLTQYTQAQIDAANKETMADLAGAAASAEDVAGVSEILNNGLKINPTATHHELLSTIVVPAARAAAINGDTHRLAVLEQVLGASFPTEVAQMRATHAEALQRRQQGQEQAAFGELDRLDNDRTPAPRMREWVEGQPDLDPTTKRRMLDRVEVIERRNLTDAQGTATNTITRDVTLRRWMPDASGTPNPAATVDHIVKRMDLDPKDPQFIDADRGGHLLNQVQGTLKHDARVSQIGEAMANMTAATGSKAPQMPATEKDDRALMANYARAGVIAAAGDADSIVLTGIKDPVRFAFFSRNFNRVPADAQALIRSGLTSAVPQQLEQAATAYAALHLQAPALARSIELPPQAAIRARYIATRIERLGPSVRTSNGELANAVRSLANAAVQMDPVLIAYTKDQTLGRVLMGNASASISSSSSFALDVHNKAEAAFKAGVFHSDAFKGRFEEGSVWNPFNPRSGLEVGQVPANVLESYVGFLDEEFRYARSLMPDEQSAVKTAKAWAMDRTLERHPPSAWNGRVYFGAPGTPAAIEADILGDLNTPPVGAAAGFPQMAEDRAEDLKAHYIPVWDDTQGGYVFRSAADPFQLYTQWGGGSVGPLVVNPYERNPDDVAARVNEAIDNRRRTKRQPATTTPTAPPASPTTAPQTPRPRGGMSRSAE